MMVEPHVSLPEIALYALVNFAPYIVLAVWPFRDSLRLSRRASVVVVALACMAQVVLGLLANLMTSSSGSAIVSALSTASYIGFYLLLVRAHPGKLLFTLLMLSNVSSTVVFCAKCLEGMAFPELAPDVYRWSFSLCTIAVEFVLLVPLSLYMERVHRRALAQGSTMWRYLWLIPATFYLIWYRNIYFSGLSSSEMALRPDNALFSLAITAGSMLVYALVARLLVEQAENLRLQEREHRLELAQAQYANLRDRIDEARRARHDLRQHMHVISACLHDGQYERLADYVRAWEGTLPDDAALSYCDNYAANALLLHFAQQAIEAGTSFEAAVSLPLEAGVPDDTLAVVLGNLLENAVEACARQASEPRRIFVRGRMDGGDVLLVVENTCDGRPRSGAGGQLLSSKREGAGVGLGSVRAAVEALDGVLQLEPGEKTFKALVMLPGGKPAGTGA